MAATDNQRIKSVTNRSGQWRSGAVIVLLAVLAAAWYLLSADRQSAPADHNPIRMPAGKPLLEPGRPDLIGDPGIEKEDNEQTGLPDE